MPNPNPVPTTQQILASLPAGAARVQVVDAAGKTRWRTPDKVRSTDTIALNANQEPTVMKGTPGRPGRVELEPASEEVAEVRRQKREILRNDSLVNRIAADVSVDPLPEIMVGLAEEIASLKFEREEAERQGEDTSMLSTRRIKGLTALGDTWIKRAERVSSIDLDGDQFQLLFRFILTTFRATLEEAGLRPEQVETVFTRLGKTLDDGWKAEARAKMKGR